MDDYYGNADDEIKKYFSFLEPDFPHWLEEYINTEELLSQSYISTTCGTIYSNLFESDYFFSSLDHSVAVALIVWHFTHDKRQTLAGLFHDIATPAFKHCVDFLNKDYMKQESTEALTTEIIKNSKNIMSLLKRDDIRVDEVDNYHVYPIADNDTPKLSADRLEYSLSNALFTYKLLKPEKIKMIYDDIGVQKNEENEFELGFKTKNLACDFVDFTSKLSVIYRDDRTRFSMQFLADVLEKLITEKIISKSDLYKLKEKEIIQIIENSKYKSAFLAWRNTKRVYVSKDLPKNTYFVKQATKVRYINPLFNGKRISECCDEARKMIKNNLAYDMNNYVYLNFQI